MTSAVPRFLWFLGPLAVLFLPVLLHAECGPYNISAVPGKPFVADVTTTDFQLSPDGTKTPIHADRTSAMQIHIARDASGRISIQSHIPQRLTGSSDAAGGPQQWTTWICDPGAGTTTTLSTGAPASVLAPTNLEWTGTVRATPGALVEPAFSCQTFSPPAQDLGAQQVEGFEVHGCRADVVAKGAPVKGRFAERWWSSDLDSDLEGAKIDQAAGTEQQWVVTNLGQSDPDPSVFQLPAHVTMAAPAPAPGL
ncbi:MAG: hypothetical protein WB974_09535 [Acidobacteriaceae bacterium]